MTPNAVVRRKLLYSLLGDLPARNRPISCRTVGTETRKEGYLLEDLLLDLNGMEDVPAYFVRPAGRSGRMPAILYNHWHAGQYKLGRNELVQGNGGLEKPPYAEELTRRGIAALCIDSWAFGGRSTRTESQVFKDHLWHGRVMWGMMVYDAIRAIDYLCSRDDVDASRLGTMGISMGSTMAWWVAALDERIKVCVDICCLTDYQALLDAGGLDRHGLYYYVPGLLKHFTAAQVNALIAPRAHLAIAGEKDGLTPVAGLDRIEPELNRVYAAAGAPDAWKLLRHPGGHEETPAGRAAVLEFIDRWL